MAYEKNKDKSAKVKERKRKSLDYWEPIYQELEEVYQASKCRTSPIMVTDGTGKSVEDTSRTNVCMPAISIMHRKNVARLTANPPQINYISRMNPDVAEKLTAWSYWQYDITNEAEVQRKHVGQGELFGFSVTKLFFNDVVERKKYRLKTSQASRRQLMDYQGKEDSEIAEAERVLGPELNDNERVQAQAEYGPEIAQNQTLKKYAGPTVKFIFFGDFYLPPGCESLDSAPWVIEDYVETEKFFEYWIDKTYTDPDSGEDVPVFEKEAVDELIESDRELPSEDKATLRQRFRAIVKLDTEEHPIRNLSAAKQFKITECHEKREDGRTWVYWIGNDDIFLGEMPYPWDLNGQYIYTDFVPLPDLVSAVGDSTPRLGRFLHRLHNAAVGQRTDLINQVLRPMMLTRLNADIPEDAIERIAYREMRLKNLDDVRLERIPNVPPEAWENENAVLRVMGMLEPALLSADLAGTNANPQTGRTATVGVLAQRERDVLLQYKVDALNIYWKKLYQKKLWMLQQTLNEPLNIGKKYFSEGVLQKLSQANEAPGILDKVKQIAGQILGRKEAISMRSGSAEVINLDWTEIQEDIQVEPEAGSTLAIDDEFHRMSAEKLFQMSLAAPNIIDPYYAAEEWAGRIKGIDKKRAVLPKPTAPEPQLPKVNVNVSVPFDKVPSDIQNQLLQEMGLAPSEEAVHRDTLDGIEKIGRAADAAAKLAEPVGAGGEKPTRRTLADRA